MEMVLQSIICSVLIAAAHPVHESFLNISWSEEKQLFISNLRIPLNDLKEDYRNVMQGESEPDFNFKTAADRKITEGWLCKRVKLFSGPEECRLMVLDIKLASGEIIIAMEFHISNLSDEFKVHNSILSDARSDQSNFLIFSCRNFEKGVKLSSEIRECTFIIKEMKGK
jgi:hypothetical protein